MVGACRIRVWRFRAAAIRVASDAAKQSRWSSCFGVEVSGLTMRAWLTRG